MTNLTSDPLYLRKAVAQVVDLVAADFEKLCREDRQWIEKYESGDTDFIHDYVARACQRVGLSEQAFWFGTEIYLSLNVLFGRQLTQAINRVRGVVESLGADGYPANLSNWIPDWDGKSPKPLEMLEQTILSDTPAEGYYGRGVTLLINSVPELAVVDFDRVCELDSKYKCAAYAYRAIAKWQLNDRAGALADAQYADKINMPGPGAAFVERVFEKIQSGDFDGDVRNIY